MTETFQVEVLHVVAPDELDDHDLDPDLRDRADGQYLLVCRRGGAPSLVERLWAFLRRDPIEAITVVSPSGAEPGTEHAVTVDETNLAGVYERVSVE